MRPQQDTAPQSSIVTSVPRVESGDVGLHRALLAVVRSGRTTSEELHDAVCRYARQARQRDVAARDTVARLLANVRVPIAPLPAPARREIERQIAWWVAQEYHRDD